MTFDPGFMRRQFLAREARLAWEAAHPELAADWTAAMVEDDERGRAKEQRRKRAEWEGGSMGRLVDMGVPQGLATLAVGPLDRTDALAAVNAFLANDRRFLWLWGKAGSGKTVAAVQALRERGPGRGLFLRATEAAALSMFEKSHTERWALALEVPVLVLDDAGMESRSDYWASRFDALVDSRHWLTAGKTVITSNLEPGQIKGHYGERISDRLRQWAPR